MLRMNAQASRSTTPESILEVGEIVEEDFDSPPLQELINEMNITVGKYFRAERNSAYESVHEVVHRCIRAASIMYGEAVARIDAEGFQWDQVKLDQDLVDFIEADYNIERLALKRQDEHRARRLNITRLLSLSEDNPELEHLRSLCGGIIVPKPEGYRPNAKCFREIRVVLLLQRIFYEWSLLTTRRLPLKIPVRDPKKFPAASVYKRPLHRSYKATYPAIDKMLSALHDQRLGLNLPNRVLYQTASTQKGVLKHAIKADSKAGRAITDISYCEPPILNGEWASAWAADTYGSITHPTIVDVVLMILDTIDKLQAADPKFSLNDIRFWKVDVSGAFTWLAIGRSLYGSGYGQ